MSLTVRFWGVRGSIPTPGPATANVGGNTSCVEVTCGDQRIILDAGTGIRELGQSLQGAGPLEATILLSHLHGDHIQGFPFFTPAFHPGSELTMVGRADELSIEQALTQHMSPPAFPVALGDVPATLRYETADVEGTTQIGKIKVRASRLKHPNGVLAYRLEHDGTSVVYATDTEHVEGEIDDVLVELARGADVLIYDAMYTRAEYAGEDGPSRRGWGHSTWNEGVNIARAAAVGQLVLFHHDPTRTDEQVASLEQAAAAELPGTVAAREGMEICLERLGKRRAA